MNSLKVALLGLAAILLFSAGYYNGIQFERSKHLQATVKSTVAITKENKDSLKESITISENTSEKIKKETEVVNEQKRRITQTTADTNVLRLALPASVIGVLHDASSR